MTWFTLFNSALSAALFPVALAVLISGLDDLTLALICLFHWLRKGIRAPAIRAPTNAVHRVAIFIPCWREAAVIGTMVEHNLAAISHKPLDLFIGAYPNDESTLAAVGELERRFPNVHLALCPHNGPTSKADCLNWIFQRMLRLEEASQLRFDVVVTHDAEDVIDPEAVTTICLHIPFYEMVQIPVLPLPTPLSELTHGVYCDEFAEFQCKDMLARGMMGSFIPSNGVGTGYSRRALELLAASDQNCLFNPASLTEDYEIGLRLHRLGCRQFFVPLKRGPRGFLATREFFPKTRSAAIRQRTRWVTGIALQTWQRHGWRGGFTQAYWFWRDRKGLVCNPLSLVANLLFLCGVATWGYAQIAGVPWIPPRSAGHAPLLACTLLLGALHAVIRMAAVAHVYTLRFALGVPVRIVWANYINGSASCRAVYSYLMARLRHQRLTWIKTEHAYPSRDILRLHKRPLEDILIESGYVTSGRLRSALAGKPEGVGLGQHLINVGLLTEHEFCHALSLQQSIPAGRLEPASINARTARSLPRRVIQKWRVLPYRVQSGHLYLATADVPSDELNAALRVFTGLTLRFQLVTSNNFRELSAALL